MYAFEKTVVFPNIKDCRTYHPTQTHRIPPNINRMDSYRHNNCSAKQPLTNIQMSHCCNRTHLLTTTPPHTLGSHHSAKAHTPNSAPTTTDQVALARADAGDEVYAKASLAVLLPTGRCTLGSNDVLVSVSQLSLPAVIGLASV